MKKVFIIFLLVISSVILLSVVIVAALNFHILNKSSDYILAQEELEDGNFDAVLVLGAGIKSDGTPSDILRDRLLTAIELYNNGIADTIILSGDRSGEDYDEVKAMERFCIDSGIPSDAIIRDNAGYSTYESVYNTKKNTDFKKIVVVTQTYHLYRAIYISRQMGFESYGISADIHNYRGQYIRDIREIFARVKDFFQVSI